MAQQLQFIQPSSYDHGICHESLLGFTLHGHLDQIISQQPDHQVIASVFEDKRFTYREFQEQTRIIARALMAHGIKRGDRIGIWSANNWRWLAILYAVARVGGILVNINPAYRSHELEYVLNQSGVKLLCTIANNRGSDYLGMLDGLSKSTPELQNIVIVPTATIAGEPLTAPARGRMTAWDDFVASADTVSINDLLDRENDVQFDDAVNIQYTSGTTGFPKGVTLSHFNLLQNGFLAARAMALDPDSRFCIPMPFYHCGGMVSSALAVLSVGGTIVMPGPYFEELSVMKAVQSEKCTHLSGVPTMFIAQLEHPEFKNYDYTSLHGGFLAGAPCPVQLMRRVASELHVRDVVIFYGLTEVAPLMTATTISDSLELRATTVGRIIPGAEIKLIDPIDGKIVPRGTQGEICCRGHGIMLGYWQNEQATRECIDSSRWLHSGDLGVMNADGYINITGRKKDMIIRGGENVYPREIEEVLHTHPAIAQAQVFGLPDAKYGEEIALWAMVRPEPAVTASELVEWLREKIAHYKVPNVRYIRFVESFPMTVSGKIQKFAMREAMVAELNLEKARDIETA